MNYVSQNLTDIKRYQPEVTGCFMCEKYFKMCIINYICEFPFIILAADVRGLELKWLRAITPAPEVPCLKSPSPNTPCIKKKKNLMRIIGLSIILLGYSASDRLFANEHMHSSQ